MPTAGEPINTLLYGPPKWCTEIRRRVSSVFECSCSLDDLGHIQLGVIDYDYLFRNEWQQHKPIIEASDAHVIVISPRRESCPPEAPMGCLLHDLCKVEEISHLMLVSLYRRFEPDQPTVSPGAFITMASWIISRIQGTVDPHHVEFDPHHLEFLECCKQQLENLEPDQLAVDPLSLCDVERCVRAIHAIRAIETSAPDSACLCASLGNPSELTFGKATWLLSVLLLLTCGCNPTSTLSVSFPAQTRMLTVEQIGHPAEDILSKHGFTRQSLERYLRTEVCEPNGVSMTSTVSPNALQLTFAPS